MENLNMISGRSLLSPIGKLRSRYGANAAKMFALVRTSHQFHDNLPLDQRNL